MEKFKSLSKLTNDFLHGKLSRIKLEYEDPNTLDVSIIYEYANYYELDYKMVINLVKENVDFVSHHNGYGLNQFDFDREIDFESAVKKTLLHST